MYEKELDQGSQDLIKEPLPGFGLFFKLIV